MISSGAILFFTRKKEGEAMSKKISGSYHQNSRVTSSLIDKTISILKASGLPYYKCYDEQTSPHSFGEKLATAASDIFEKGIEKLIIIGNDCPQLTTEILNKAWLELEENDMVIGPDKRGGIYLMGISRKKFDQEEFMHLPWQTSNLFNETVMLCQLRSLSCKTLSTLYDINAFEDLKKVYWKLATDDQFRIFLKSLFLFETKIFDKKIIASKLNDLFPGLRAPPMAA